ncbi:MAG: hypothetical protein IKN96_04070 [Oscillibacter sp.]|nr:hypothetical protein [Oscillibacter sp.]
MKRTIGLLLAALILLGVACGAGLGADASETERAALLEDGVASGGSVSSGGSVGSGGSVTSGEGVGSGDAKEPVQLPPPSRLGWGRDYRFLLEYYRKQQPEKIQTDAFGAEYAECPGMMYWAVDAESQRRYRIDLYMKDPEAEPTLIETVKEWKSTPDGTMDSNFRFFWNPRSSGEYYFTVRAIGDGIEYLDSEAAQSDTWIYEAPETRLTAPERPRWKNVTEASTVYIYPPLDEGADSLYRIGYEARWWYVAALTKDDEEEVVADGGEGSTVVTTEDSGDTEEDPTKPKEVGTVLTFYPRHYEFKPSEKMIGEFGSGYYSVEIRALSGDVNKARPSDWSELSMARYIKSEDDDLQAIVDRVDKNTDELNRQLAIDNVRRFGTYKLVEMMSADTDNTGAAAAIAQLENITGNYAQIRVSGGLNEIFPEQNIGVVGAGLNVDLGQTVVFHLGAAHADEVPPSLYSHAVRFSMQLLDTNGASLTPDGTELKVPAKITLPVPANINPSFFTILHHRMDGTVETIPRVALRKVENQWHASFILTSFSDFTMAEAAALMEAKAAGGGVSLSYRFKTQGVQTALCAVRDASGRLLGAASLPLSESNRTVQIPCGGVPADAKLFLLDARSAPIVAALSVPVQR